MYYFWKQDVRVQYVLRTRCQFVFARSFSLVCECEDLKLSETYLVHFAGLIF